MSDNDDLLGDDLGDQSLADYNLGNEEEEQLLADDYDAGGPQNVPSSLGPQFREPVDMVPVEYPGHAIEFSAQPMPYQAMADTECVVPNIIVEVPTSTVTELPTYVSYEPVYEPEHAVVPPAIPAVPLESPQIVPSEMTAPLPVPNGDMGTRERFVTERPPGAQRLPQVRDIPDSLDKVVVPRWGPRWRPPHYHPYRHTNHHNNNHHHNNHHMRPHRGNFSLRASFPPPQIRHNPPQIRPEIRPVLRPDFPPEVRPVLTSEIPDIRHEPPPQLPQISPERLPPEFRPVENRPPFQNYPRFQFRPNMEEPRFGPRSNFERPMFYRPNFPQRPFGPHIREIASNDINRMPQVTIRQAIPMDSDKFGPKGPPLGREPEVRMLPVQLPTNLPPGGLAGKKVLINPHFKGNFQSPVEGLPTYIPTRIQKSPPLSPTLESKFGPIKDIDDAAERFIAEQRNALARAASRKFVRRSPQRYISNTTVEIANELAPRGDADLLRRQEEFIHANRAGLRRRMRSPVPQRRSPSPRRSPERRSPERRSRPDPPRHDEESEYGRLVREQESLRERVLRAKEVRRRRLAAALHTQHKDRENQEKEPPKPEPKPEITQPIQTIEKPTSTEPEVIPDTTRKSPEKDNVEVQKVEKVERERSPVRDDTAEVNSTCENLTPPRPSPERDLTPPLPRDLKRSDSDDDLDLILGDIDGILSDDDDSGRFKENVTRSDAPKSKPQVDLRSKLPPKPATGDKKLQRQKIVFEEREEKKRKEKSAPRRAAPRDNTDNTAKSKVKVEVAASNLTSAKSRQRIVFDPKEPEKPKEEDKKTQQQSTNRRVIIQRKITQSKDKSVFSRIEVTADPTKPNPGIFSRAVRTAIGTEKPRIVIKKVEEPEVQFESDSGDDDDKILNDEIGNIAIVVNLPHGMTDTRMKTLAGDDVQNLILDKEKRTANITFKNTVAAEGFKKKFNNKMVAASRLTVTLR